MKHVCSLCLLVIMGCNLPAQIQTDPNDLAGQAYDLRLAGQSDQALALLNQATKDYPKDDRLWFELARTHWHQWPVKHNFIPIAKAMDKACKLAPDNGRYWIWAGHAHTYSGIARAHNAWTWGAIPGEMTKAAKCLQKGLTLDPNYHEARTLLYSLYHNNPWFLGGNKKKAQAVLKEAESVDIIGATRIKAEAISYHEPQKRLNLWLDLLKIQPNNAFVHEQVSGLYAKLGKTTLAQEHARKAMALDPTRRTLLIGLARTISKQDPALAQQLTETYLEDDTVPAPLRANALNFLSALQKQQGHEQEAQATTEQAQALDPYTWQDSPDFLDLFTARP